MKQTATPNKRITSIDAIRGFAIFGILMVHCMEYFDLIIPARESCSPFWSRIDTLVHDAIFFLFAGKAYAIFSLLFGLSFFIQMESQMEKGNDFRLRFVWRLLILLGLGYLNGLIYMGEFFVIYAMLGIILIPLYKVPTKWLVGVLIILLLQIPDMITFLSLLNGNIPNKHPEHLLYMFSLYDEASDVFLNGSFTDVLKFNMWKGQFAKLLWVFNNTRYLQLTGLFIAGMLTGRYGIHKNEEKMVKCSHKVLPYSIGIFGIFYTIVLLLPVMGINEYALNAGTTLFKSYANLGMMMMYICGLILLYYRTYSRKILETVAPVGRMSVTNYMVQVWIGLPLFYGFGANLAIQLTSAQSLLVGLVIYALQVIYSNWWMKRFYYGPIEWIWRILTWFQKVPLRRNTI